MATKLPPKISGDFQTRFNKMPEHYRSLYDSLVDTYKLDFQDPTAINAYISSIDKSLAEELGQRPGAESAMRNNRNAVENLFNYLHLGRDIPAGVFQLPAYKQTKGYR